MSLKSDWEIKCGDCCTVMSDMEENSVDAIVTDPPYGLAFMNKEFDKLGDGPAQQAWHLRWAKEALRVLKPGGHIICFGGSRTYHRVAVAIEDAGFEIRDQMMWIYGSGFPKGRDIARAIDKELGHEREAYKTVTKASPGYYGGVSSGETKHESYELTKPVSELAQKYDGFSTQLKPAHEPMVLGRKPFKGAIHKNVMEHGTGAMNIDGCRVGASERWNGSSSSSGFFGGYEESGPPESAGRPATGRWPPNIILQHGPGCVKTGRTKEIGRGEIKRVGSDHDAERYKLGEGANVTGGGADKRSLGCPVGDRPAGQISNYGTEVVDEWECEEGCAVAALEAQTGADNAFFPALSPLAEGEKSEAFFQGVSGKYRPGQDSSSEYAEQRGRWPANVMLSHSPDCRVVGKRTVGSGERKIQTPAEIEQTEVTERCYGEYKSRKGGTVASFGTEVVDDWECAEGCPVAGLDAQSGKSQSRMGGWGGHQTEYVGGEPAEGGDRVPRSQLNSYDDEGGASRYFEQFGYDEPFIYSPKASRRDRGKGNIHPTVKPTPLMKHLCRLVTPPGGLVMDPFCGSGSTGVAAIAEGFRFIGIEMNPEYVEIIKRRLGAPRQATIFDVTRFEATVKKL